VSGSSTDVNGLVRSLTTWTNVVLLALLVVTIGLVVYPGVIGTDATASPPPPAYEVGGVIDTPADWYDQSAFTLLLFAQASCGACQRAQPFLRQVVSESGARVPVVLVSPGADQAGDAEFGVSLGLEPGGIRRAPNGLRARVTPTLVLVNRSGTILHAWEGVPPDRQPAIRKAIQQATAGL
jgi:hypothetical protein